MTTRRGFVAGLASVAAATSGCLNGGVDPAGSLVIYAVPPPNEVEGGEDVESLTLEDERLDVRPVRIAVQRAPVYKGRDLDEGLDATSEPLDSQAVYDEVEAALEATPSVEAGEPYPVGGTVVEFDGNYFIVSVEGA